MPATLTPEMAAALALGEATLEHGPDNAGAPLSKLVRSVAVDTIRWLTTVPPDRSRKQAQWDANVGPTKELELEAIGVFEAYADGTRIRVSSRSIARRRLRGVPLAAKAMARNR